MYFKKIISWYNQNKRDLPWRNTKDPYKIWLSEIILQQTRVAQGLPYYIKFVENFPNIQSLANADESEVLRLWQGLGYYSRGRNLQKTAKAIVNNHKGIFPNEYDDLKMLPGIGPYTAAAIASFAFDKLIPAVDGNVLRVISRYYGILDAIEMGTTQKNIFNLSLEQILAAGTSTYNQAVMELGATVCTPKKPDCVNCPVNIECETKKNGAWEQIPNKSKKTKVLNRTLHYMVLVFDEKIWMRKRPEGDIWSNMFDFYLIDDRIINQSKLEIHSNLLKNHINAISYHKHYKKTIMHKLTHRNLTAIFEIFDLEKLFNISDGQYFTFEQIEQLPKPKIIDDIFGLIKSNSLN